MQVETYEVTDIGPGGVPVNEETDAEALALIETLELEGQRTRIVQHTTPSGEVVETRLPYRLMTSEEQRIYGVLCPMQTEVQRYASGPIPLRVLQVIAHARDYFSNLMVWHPADPREKDPVLVGVREEQLPGELWKSRHSYLLARWGETLEPLETLRPRAAMVWEARARAEIAEKRHELDQTEARLEANLALYVTGATNPFRSSPLSFLLN